MSLLKKIIGDDSLVRELYKIQDAEEIVKNVASRAVLKLLHNAIMLRDVDLCRPLVKNIIENYSSQVLLKVLGVLDSQHKLKKAWVTELKVLVLRGIADKGTLEDKVKVIRSYNLKPVEGLILAQLSSNSVLNADYESYLDTPKEIIEVFADMFEGVVSGEVIRGTKE